MHLGAPQSPVAYYQQIGRAGRGVERADVVLLPGREDRDIWAYFASLAFPPERQVRATLDALADAGRPLSTAAIETHVDLSPRAAGVDAEGARRGRRGDPRHGGWVATGQPWAYDGERYERVAARAEPRAAGDARLPGDRGAGWSSCAASSTTPRQARCGRCDNCTGQRWSAERRGGRRGGRAGPAGPPGRDGRAAQDVAVGHERPGDRRASGKIPAGQLAEPGRALGRLTDIGWGSTLARCSPSGARRAGHRAARRTPWCKVLAALGLEAAARCRGDDAVTVAARLVASLGQRIATIGRLSYLGALGYATPDGPGARRHNSAQRLATVWRALTVPDELRAALDGHATGRSCSSTTRSTPAGR